MRQIVVLKHEIAGLRPTPNARAAPANQNAAAAPNARRWHPHDAARDRRDTHDYNDYDRPLNKEQEEALDHYLDRLITALDIDLERAPPEIQAEAAGQSVAVKLTRIATSIPHPALNAELADIEMAKLWDVLAPKQAGDYPGNDPPE